MILLDMRTIVFTNVVTDIVCIMVILSLWHQTRKRFAGTGFWVFDFAFQTAALFLVIFRGNLPGWMSMVLANTLVIAGALLGYMGLERFVGKKSLQVHNYVLLAAFACVHSYFAFVQPNLAARNLNLSVGLLIICFQCMWLLLSRVGPGMRRLTVGVGMVFGAYCLVSIVRIVEFFTGTHSRNDYFQSSLFETLVLVCYQMLFIFLTYSLTLMFNKRLLLEVKTQEEKFSKAFHSVPYAITLTRLSDGQIIEVNDGFVNITGYNYPDLLGKTTVGLHFWDKEEDRVVAVNELSKSGKVQGREFQFRKKSGEMFTGLFSAEIIPINNQEFIISSISDITERKRAEEALRESEEAAKRLAQENAVMAEIGRIISSTMNIEEVYEHFAENVFKLIPFDLITISINNIDNYSLKIAYVAGIEVLGRKRGDAIPLAGTLNEEIMHRRSGTLIHMETESDFSDRYPSLLNAFRAGLRSVMAIPLISKDQVIGALQLWSIKPKNYTQLDLKLAERVGNQIAGAIANAQLFVERKAAEKALRESEEKYRNVVERGNDGIAIIQDGRFSYVNQMLAKMLGYTVDEAIGTSFTGYICSEELPRVIELYKRRMAGEGLENINETAIIHRDGHRIDVELNAALITYHGRMADLVFIRDITQRKQLQIQLSQAQKLESIGQLAAGIAHEINSPTQYIGDNTRFIQNSFNDLFDLVGKYRGLLKTAKEGPVSKQLIDELEKAENDTGLEYLSEEIPKAIEQSLEGLNRVATIVSAMKEFSHPGTKEKTLVDINKAIETTITVSRNEWKYVAEMVTDFDPSLPLVPSLPGEFNQVMLNVIVNAAHAIADIVGNGSSGKGFIKVSTRHDGDRAEIRISDTGVGIPKEIRNRIFDPFFTTKTVGKGTGQGLAIARSVVVDKHGGTIDFESEVGKGSTFIIHLPLDGMTPKRGSEMKRRIIYGDDETLTSKGERGSKNESY